MNKRLIVSCTSGLCNRVHALLGSKRLAERFGRELQVFWAENAELNASANFVFANPPSLIQPDDLLFHLSRPEITVRIFNSGFGPCLECDHVEDSYHDIIFIKPWFVPRLKGQPHTSRTYFPLRQYLGEFSFNPEIVKLANPVHYSNHIGIHIRYGDPRPDGTFRQTEYFSESDIERFKHVMDLITRKRPETRFYVSSPCESAKQELAKNFNVDYTGIVPYRSEDGIRDAIVDFTNLCGCNCLIGSYRSQFTRMVGFSTQKTVAVVSDNPHLDFTACVPATLEEISDWALRRLNSDETPDPLQSPPNSLHLPSDS